ncbi:DUF4339 domain-containing protein [Peijinzhouia sedimentorum]
MRKYFYTDGKTKFGPFLLDDLKNKDLTRDTLVWYYGLPTWTPISEIIELKEVLRAIPPPIIKSTDTFVGYQMNPDIPAGVINKPEVKKRKISRNVKVVTIILTIMFFLSTTVLYLHYYKNEDEKLYDEIVANSYSGNEDFNFYLEKFYRDLEVYGLFPKRASTIIIKFSPLDQISNATHFHAVSYGIYNDDLIEIYINPSSWKKFNKPKRYYLMYHELAHDILNVDDLSDNELNTGKLMFPAIFSYERITMDDFIEAYHELFEELSNQ